LPAKLFVTTNLDNLMSWAVSTAYTGTNPPQVVRYPEMTVDSVQPDRVIHLHGNCEQVLQRVAADAASVVLTRDQYDIAYMARGVVEQILARLFSAYRVLFVGLSFRDAAFTSLLDRLRSVADDAGRRGEAFRRGRHFALMRSSTTEEHGALDYGFRGRWIGIEPIFFYDPDGRFVSFDESLRSLVAQVTPTAAGAT
jgi:hypothetical protein